MRGVKNEQKVFTTLLFITLSFIMLDVFHIYIKVCLYL